MRVLVICVDEAQSTPIAHALRSLGHDPVVVDRGGKAPGGAFALAIVGFGAGSEGIQAAGIPALLLPEGAGEPAVREVLGRRRRAELVLRVGDLTIDLALQEVRRAGRLVALTRTQFSLLVALARRAGKIVSAEALALAVWGDASLPLNTLNVHVKNLRRRLGDSGVDSIIRTHAGFGYALGELDAG